MRHAVELESALNDPQSLEMLYQGAKRDGLEPDFAAEVARRHASSPENILLSAWYYRLFSQLDSTVQPAQVSAQSRAGGIAEGRTKEPNWRLAVALSLVLSLIYWLVSGDLGNLSPQISNLFLAWAPLAACSILAYLVIANLGTRTEPTSSRPPFFASPLGALAIGLILIALTGYAVWMGSSPYMSYRTLAILHLPLLAWAAVLLYAAGPRLGDANRYAALVKSAEIVMTGGIFFGAALAFVAITVGLFGAIGVNFLEPIQRWLVVGVPGLIPVLALALVYDPGLQPADQRFDQGLPKLIFSVARIFLPFALIVGAVYMIFIPANFLKPFDQREVLIVYNAMLFGVMALLLFATPLRLEQVPDRWQIPIRRGILALSVMTVIVSLYALSATVYRTYLGGVTMNRMTVVGWNLINIALLCLYLYRQFRFGRGEWISSTQLVFRIGIITYAIWSVFLLVAIPLLFPGG